MNAYLPMRININITIPDTNTIVNNVGPAEAAESGTTSQRSFPKYSLLYLDIMQLLEAEFVIKYL